MTFDVVWATCKPFSQSGTRANLGSRVGLSKRKNGRVGLDSLRVGAVECSVVESDCGIFSRSEFFP